MHFWSQLKQVTFSDSVTVHRYEPFEFDKLDIDPIQLSRDRSRREPRFIRPEPYMASVEYLLEKTCKKYPITIVYGDLGRYPHLLMYYLDICCGSDVSVMIHPASSYAISILEGSELRHYTYDGTCCDILIYLEPKFGTTIDSLLIKPPNAKHVIILTSHMNLDWVDPNDVIFEPETIFQSPPTKQNIQVVHLYAGKILKRPYPTVFAYIDSPPNDVDYVYRPELMMISPFTNLLEDFAQLDHLCIDVTRQLQSSDDDVCIQDMCSEAYLKLTNVCDIMRYANFKGRWYIVMEPDIRNSFVEQLKSSRTKFKKLNGLYKTYYIDPFVNEK